MNKCTHDFRHQASMDIKGLIYDIFYCSKCLEHVKKERPCPGDIKTIR